jgi:hypothetical protein
MDLKKTLKKETLISLILMTLATFFSIVILGSDAQKPLPAESLLQNRYISPFLAGCAHGFAKTVIVDTAVGLLPQKMQQQRDIKPLGTISPAALGISFAVSKPLAGFIEENLFPTHHYAPAPMPVLHHTKIITDSSLGKTIGAIPFIGEPIHMLKTCQDQKSFLQFVGNCVGITLAKSILPQKDHAGLSIKTNLFGDN